MKIFGFIKRVLRWIFTTLVKYQAGSIGKDLRINKYSKVTKNTHLGDNVNFNGIKISGLGKVVIGNNFHSGEGCYIISSNHNFNGGQAIPYDKTYITKDVIISDNVWIGINVIILAGVHIEEGAIIQAGSVVVSDVPKYAIAGGHPAKVFSQRDIKHYENLKADKKYF